MIWFSIGKLIGKLSQSYDRHLAEGKVAPLAIWRFAVSYGQTLEPEIDLSPSCYPHTRQTL
jgi:hypothetical protein